MIPLALHEAITVAQGLTWHIEGQIEIATQLMGLSEEDVRLEVLKAAARADGAGAGAAYHTHDKLRWRSSSARLPCSATMTMPEFGKNHHTSPLRQRAPR